tara:strand:- start:5341 stop:6261 length:921 start_codon:yes stop_codon:yes gene_type:complete
MTDPINQTKLFGLDNYFNELKYLFDNDKLPNKILLSGHKGSGKFTLSLHLINYILSKNEDYSYDYQNFQINEKNRSFKLVKNNSSPNFYLIDIKKEKKNIEVGQIRELINFCNKSSLNNKPRFILIDNHELMNINSNNALLKTLEEPNDNIFFIIINNSSKILQTIKSRCLYFKITLSQQESINIFNQIIDKDIYNLINNDLISHYFTPGDLLNLYTFSIEKKIDLSKMKIEEFLIEIIDNDYYKKDVLSIDLIFAFLQMYFIKKINNLDNYSVYTKFMNSIDDIKRFNLDIESLFIQLRYQIIND